VPMIPVLNFSISMPSHHAPLGLSANHDFPGLRRVKTC
jgi:hypothetical protein